MSNQQCHVLLEIGKSQDIVTVQFGSTGQSRQAANLSPEVIQVPIDEVRLLKIVRSLGIVGGINNVPAELVEQSGCHVYFEGDGGYVSVAIDIGEEKTTVELESQGWDDHIRQFVQELAEF